MLLRAFNSLQPFYPPLLTVSLSPDRWALGTRPRCTTSESVEESHRFRDHSSLAMTMTYLRRLEGQEDLSWEKVAEAAWALENQFGQSNLERQSCSTV